MKAQNKFPGKASQLPQGLESIIENQNVILSEWRIATSKVQNFAQHLIKARDILNKGIESMEKLDLSFLSKESQVERNNVIKENVEYKKAIEKILNKIK